MRIFITGGNGWVGSGIIRELVAAHHQVFALARSDAAATVVTGLGAVARRGDITEPAQLKELVADVDAVIHCAFDHRFGTSDLVGAILVRLFHSPRMARVSRAAKTDLDAIEAMLDGLGQGKVFVCTSPIAGLRQGAVGTETDALVTSSFGSIRIASELVTLAAAKRGLRTVSMRLPPSVHGTGDTGFVTTLVDTAKRTGTSAYLGTGENHWPAVHRDDAARLYRLAVEGLAAGTIPSGSVLHAVAEQGVAFRDLAGAIATRVGVPASAGKRGHFPAFVGMVAALDLQASAIHTRELTGWTPTRPGLVEDIASYR